MVFTQCSSLNHDSADIDKNTIPFVWQRTERAPFRQRKSKALMPTKRDRRRECDGC